MAGETVRVGDLRVPLTNLGKVYYPETGFTKGDVIDYYVRIAPVLLPHLKGRPLTLKRYPDGVGGDHFYQKECPPNRPAWLATINVDSSERGGPIHYCAAEDLASLVWLANAGDLELHPFLHRGKHLERPDFLAFDLDPGPGAGFPDCSDVALWLRDAFKSAGVESFAKTSGSKGIQVYVPMNTAVTYEEAKPFARRVAEALERERPAQVVSRMRKELRRGKVLVDWSQNDDHKTTVCVYSLRATPEPGVSTPLRWREVEASAKERATLRFSPKEVLRRVARSGDLFQGVLTKKQPLTG